MIVAASIFAPIFGPPTRSRDLECEHMDVQTAVRDRPGLVAPPKPRGDYVERAVLVCAERWMRPGVRPPRDEAVLETLGATATEIALVAATERPDLRGATWLVEVFYPSGQVASKIAFATKDALVSRELTVSDRTPTLGVGDVGVLTRLDPDRAYPAACRRYADTGALREGDALLAVVHLDPRETRLHAGLCVAGEWTWLR
jgi:hypothetical protein